MRVLVTGCGGFIGSLVTRKLLAKNYEVVGLDNGYRNLDNLLEVIPNTNFNLHRGDVLNKDLVNGLSRDVDFIVHLAAYVGEPICKQQPQLAWEINTTGTRNCLDSYAKVIFASTGSVYGELNSVCTEQSNTNPVSLYAKAKLESENLIRQLKPQNHIIYRFATAYGLSPNLRLDLLINDLTYQACKNKTITLFQADFKRTFCHVDDIAASLVYAVDNFDSMKGQTYNVGTEEGNWTKREVGEYLKKRTGCSVFYGDGYKDPDVRNYHCDFSKINSTGWKAKYTISEGVDELIKSVPLIQIKHNYSVV
jgi:nucleoside-diphosphate-sugar epimerase